MPQTRFHETDAFREGVRQHLMRVRREQREYDERNAKGEATTEDLLRLSESVRTTVLLKHWLTGAGEPLRR